MADQSGFDLIRFRYSDDVVLQDGEVLKLFRPETKRIMGATAQDRMIIGSLVFIPRSHLKRLRAPSVKFEQPRSGEGCPIANFPWLLEYCWLSDGIDKRLLEALVHFVAALPDDEAGWRVMFGSKAFSGPSEELDFSVSSQIIAFLRSQE